MACYCLIVESDPCLQMLHESQLDGKSYLRLLRSRSLAAMTKYFVLVPACHGFVIVLGDQS